MGSPYGWRTKWGVSQNLGYLLGVPIARIIECRGLHWGQSILENYQILDEQNLNKMWTRFALVVHEILHQQELLQKRLKCHLKPKPYKIIQVWELIRTICM